jgi:hypothetical protein
MEQADTEILFERMDLMADRRRGHKQLRGRFREALMARRRFERAQRRKRRQMLVHVRIPQAALRNSRLRLLAVATT